jgi:hypothetical protein
MSELKSDASLYCPVSHTLSPTPCLLPCLPHPTHMQQLLKRAPSSVPVISHFDHARVDPRMQWQSDGWLRPPPCVPHPRDADHFVHGVCATMDHSENTQIESCTTTLQKCAVIPRRARIEVSFSCVSLLGWRVIRHSHHARPVEPQSRVYF